MSNKHPDPFSSLGLPSLTTISQDWFPTLTTSHPAPQLSPPLVMKATSTILHKIKGAEGDGGEAEDEAEALTLMGRLAHGTANSMGRDLTTAPPDAQ